MCISFKNTDARNSYPIVLPRDGKQNNYAQVQYLQAIYISHFHIGEGNPCCLVSPTQRGRKLFGRWYREILESNFSFAGHFGSQIRPLASRSCVWYRGYSITV